MAPPTTADDNGLHHALITRAVEPIAGPEERDELAAELVAQSGERREPLERAHHELQQRLTRRSNDFEATAGLRALEAALDRIARPPSPLLPHARRRRRWRRRRLESR